MARLPASTCGPPRRGENSHRVDRQWGDRRKPSPHPVRPRWAAPPIRIRKVEKERISPFLPIVDDVVTRFCVFCGGSGNLTNEDAWPRWLIRHIVKKGAVVNQRWGSQQGLTGFTSRRQNVTVRRVCANCNNGWMSDLEVAAKPLLLPWTDGGRTRLRYGEQETIATWAVKTTMMLQYTPMSTAGIVIPANHYAALFTRKSTPPDSVEVLIGLEPTQPPGALFALRRVDVAREHWGEGLTPTRERYLGYEATLIAKGLVLKVLGHAGPSQIRMTEEFVIKPELGLTQIWPVQSSGGVLLPANRLVRRIRLG